jgi:hypothetical protein
MQIKFTDADRRCSEVQIGRGRFQEPSSYQRFPGKYPTARDFSSKLVSPDSSRKNSICAVIAAFRQAQMPNDHEVSAQITSIKFVVGETVSERTATK